MSYFNKCNVAALLSTFLLAGCGAAEDLAGKTQNKAQPLGSKAAVEAARGAQVPRAIAASSGAAKASPHRSMPPAGENSGERRDDVEAYIDSLPDTAEQKQALRQTATALGSALSANVRDGAQLGASSAKISSASSCLFSRYPSAMANKRAREIERMLVNTKQRADAYEAYNLALSGSSSQAPRGDGCEGWVGGAK